MLKHCQLYFIFENGNDIELKSNVRNVLLNSHLSNVFGHQTSHHHPVAVNEQVCFSRARATESDLLKAQFTVCNPSHVLCLKSRQRELGNTGDLTGQSKYLKYNQSLPAYLFCGILRIIRKNQNNLSIPELSHNPLFFPALKTNKMM